MESKQICLGPIALLYTSPLWFKFTRQACINCRLLTMIVWGYCWSNLGGAVLVSYLQCGCHHIPCSTTHSYVLIYLPTECMHKLYSESWWTLCIVTPDTSRPHGSWYSRLLWFLSFPYLFLINHIVAIIIVMFTSMLYVLNGPLSFNEPWLIDLSVCGLGSALRMFSTDIQGTGYFKQAC